MIVVTAPTSNIGRRVLDHVIEGGARARVIARDPSHLPAEVRSRVDVVEGSHRDRDVVTRAFEGADAVFWLVPPNPRAGSVDDVYVSFTQAAAALFRSGGVKRVVGITALGRGTPQAANAGLVTGSLAMDDQIAGTGVRYRAIANPSFMDNVARQAQMIRTKGVFFGPIDGDRRQPTCAVRDIAQVSAKWLLDDTWNGAEEVAVLGPEDLSFNDMAAIMSEMLGREVRYQQIPFDAYRSGFVERGMSDAIAQAMTDMARAKNEGLDNGEPRTPANTTPTSFRRWCDDELKPALAG